LEQRWVFRNPYTAMEDGQDMTVELLVG
jgi:hypothetical protein